MHPSSHKINISPFAYVPHVERVRGVVFDFGGVLMEAGPMHAAQFGMRKGLSTEVWRELARELFVVGDAWNAVERGERSLDDFGLYLQSRVEKSGGEMNARDVYHLMGDIEDPLQTPLREEMVNVCSALHQVMPVVLLTNNVREWSALWRKRLQIDAMFHVVVDSCEVGVRKPDERIYRMVEKQLGFEGENILFVDDLGVNLKAASMLSWQTVRATQSGTEALAVLHKILNLHSVTSGHRK